MEQKRTNDREMVQAVYGYAAQLMRDGQPNFKIEKALIEKGLPTDAARSVVRNLDQERQRQYSQSSHDAAMRNMAIGGVICLIGLVVSIGSYQAVASSASGGSYVVAWGAVIFGGFQFLKGLFSIME